MELSEQDSKELEDFYDRSPHRGLAIALSALIDNRLTSYLRAAMRPEVEIATELFRPSGPLGNFGTKIRLAYMLGLIAPTTYKDLITINKIRNKFAHDINIKDLNQDPITAWIKGMYIYSLFKPLAEDAREETDSDLVKSATKRIFKYATKDVVDAFRTAVRLYLLHLANLEKQQATSFQTDPSLSSPRE